jgi:hypothetical protein
MQEMPYTQEISRQHPALFVFLLDQQLIGGCLDGLIYWRSPD